MVMPSFLYKLLGYTSFSGKLSVENLLVTQVTSFLREKTLDGALPAVWTHLPNEGLRSKTTAALVRAMGMISGAPDYVFCWQGGAGFIKLKTPTGNMSERQTWFKQWCDHNHVHHAICRSVPEVEAALILWGVIRD